MQVKELREKMNPYLDAFKETYIEIAKNYTHLMNSLPEIVEEGVFMVETNSATFCNFRNYYNSIAEFLKDGGGHASANKIANKYRGKFNSESKSDVFADAFKFLYGEPVYQDSEVSVYRSTPTYMK